MKKGTSKNRKPHESRGEKHKGKRNWKRLLLWIGSIITFLLIALTLLAQKPKPERITYGFSFDVSYAQSLGLDPKEVYMALLDDLGVRHFRLSALWTIVEPEKNRFDFSALDYQIAEAQKRGADIILGVGRRLPRWPECHVPVWAAGLSWDEQKNEIRAYLKEVVNRYKNKPNIIYWQVENEPYLGLFAHDQCGDLDEAFLKEEIALVRELDNTRPILVTDSGNLGTWKGAYSAGDAFGTSMYLYLWNPQLGPIRTILPPVIYRIKENLMKLFYGKKPTFLIELSLEPWLLEKTIDAPIEKQFERMNPEKFDEIIQYAKDTRYTVQYLWGGEWWYWLKKQGHAEMWEKGETLFGQ
jgi:hypothetical protein